MHKFRQIRRAALLTILAAAAAAADVTGNWTTDVDTPQGLIQVFYSFKQEGEVLTGTFQAADLPEVPISEGKVAGDKLVFIVKLDVHGGMTIAHEGTVKGDEIQLTMKPSGEFPGSTVVAKRAK